MDDALHHEQGEKLCCCPLISETGTGPVAVLTLARLRALITSMLKFSPCGHEGRDHFFETGGAVCLKPGEEGVGVVWEGCWAVTYHLDGPMEKYSQQPRS